jgi:phage tail-like protein
MPKFVVNANRYDPYKNFKFRVKFGDNPEYVAGVSKVSALKRITEMVEHREGGDPSSSHRSPGRTKYEPITMERGVTHDPAFEQWANRVWNYSNAQAPFDARTQEVSLKNFRRELSIDLFNEAGQKVMSYKVYKAWVSEYTAQADLDANANAILIQSIKIEHEGWERDPSVTEPAEPMFDGSAAA